MGEHGVVGENRRDLAKHLLRCHFVKHKSDMKSPGIEVGRECLTSELRHAQAKEINISV